MTPALRSAMIRAMLEDRFKLTTHRETRELPVYNLVVARSDGRLGPNLKKSALDCDAINKEQRANPQPRQLTIPQPGDVIRCSPRIYYDASRVSTMNVDGVDISGLVMMLQRSLSRPLFDKTGLTGDYDIRLRFLPDPGATGGFVNPQANPTPPPPPDDVPVIFTAVQEQLGLKIEPRPGPIEVLVIDRIERPTDN